ncbi:hypothetical protein [Kribbella sp. CA-293567]|uniref:hypothetical protein n=1 Tax=Kribbella sp. CA-293567 TaxID=3002436 RepID=UPI0022DDBC4D|nr:hypothetical protein [Kribbella sp. CA-293567]WBQ06827.1 hypothetical protein OX958_08535 [Kribbella sp. CA-293567]
MTAPATTPTEFGRVVVTLAGHPVIDHVIAAERAPWYADAMARRYRSCDVSSAPYRAGGAELAVADVATGDRP